MASMYLHTLDGRIRVKVAGVKGSPDKAFDLENALRQVDGIDAIRANPITGSVLILYDPARTNQLAVIAALRHCGGRDQENASEARTSMLRAQEIGHKLAESVISTVLESAVRSLVAALI